MALNIIEETVKLPEDILRHFLDPYEDLGTDRLALANSYFAPIPASHDLILIERVTVNFSNDPRTVVKPDRKPSAQLHHSFVKCWEQMQGDERTNSVCHRTYWLGDAWPTDEINEKLISQYLVKGLAEKVKRFKANIGLHQLIPYVAEVDKSKPHTYRAGQPYRSWFEENRSRSKFEWKIVNDFANDRKIKPILDVYAFGYTTPVITAEEIEGVYEELKANPTPQIEATGIVDNTNKFDQLAGAVTQLVEIQTNNLKKG